MTTEDMTGLGPMPTPEKNVLLLTNDQPFQFANRHSHEPTMGVNNVVGLVKRAQVYDIPTILTTVVEEQGGRLLQRLQDVPPEAPNSTLASSAQVSS